MRGSERNRALLDKYLLFARTVVSLSKEEEEEEKARHLLRGEINRRRHVDEICQNLPFVRQ